MKKITYLQILILFLPLLATAQSFTKIGYDLTSAIERGERSSYKVTISFNEKANLDSLITFFTNREIDADDRPFYVIRELQQVAENSQKEVLAWLQKEVPTEEIHAFWIINRIMVDLNARQIERATSFDQVDMIRWERARFEPLPEWPVARDFMTREVGIAEPGLVAINARPLWELGYTGRGQLVYDYDTGVWPDHPAFNERYLGNRFPNEQSWYGYFRDYPNGKVANHGTHTLGTIAGLVEETNDTLGVAFGSYWIANDLVVSSVNDLAPVEELVYAYEWALNPDGNINTGDDVPDVINNSWRFSDEPTTEYCEGWVVDLLIATEAAGIASVFSGGNAGPDNLTVSAPQRINTSIVNTFSVGSIDANQNAPFPISSFSTRGPTQCDGEGSLKIHPQVVAPGQNVRSAWGNNGYNTISGTSMSAPHVSGAVLLLKEAFPYLPGADILWALYHSAIDYGEPGEDNIYGNGLIDVKAAFDLLSQDHDPVDPLKIEWDMAIDLTTETRQSNIVCESVINAKVNILNMGEESPDSLTIKYWFADDPDTTSITLPGDANRFETGPIILNSFGSKVLYFSLSYPSSSTLEYDVYNNRCRYDFIRSSEKTLPIVENFEHGINDSLWIVDNPDLNIGWDTFPTAGLEGSLYSASLQFYNYSPREGQKDALLMSNISIEDLDSIELSYEYAYQPFFGSNTIRDTFRIFVIEGCRQYERMLIKEAAGDELYVSDSIFINFKPAFEGHWRKETIDLSAFAGERISLLFEGTNMKWNNLYLDNIRLEEVFPTETEEIYNSNDVISIYPNPADQQLTLQLLKASLQSGSELILMNGTGHVVLKKLLVNGKEHKISLSGFPEGVYSCLVLNNGKCFTKSFIKSN